MTTTAASPRPICAPLIQFLRQHPSNTSEATLRQLVTDTSAEELFQSPAVPQLLKIIASNRVYFDLFWDALRQALPTQRIKLDLLQSGFFDRLFGSVAAEDCKHILSTLFVADIRESNLNLGLSASTAASKILWSFGAVTHEPELLLFLLDQDNLPVSVPPGTFSEQLVAETLQGAAFAANIPLIRYIVDDLRKAKPMNFRSMSIGPALRQAAIAERLNVLRYFFEETTDPIFCELMAYSLRTPAEFYFPKNDAGEHVVLEYILQRLQRLYADPNFLGDKSKPTYDNAILRLLQTACRERDLTAVQQILRHAKSSFQLHDSDQCILETLLPFLYAFKLTDVAEQLLEQFRQTTPLHELLTDNFLKDQMFFKPKTSIAEAAFLHLLAYAMKTGAFQLSAEAFLTGLLAVSASKRREDAEFFIQGLEVVSFEKAVNLRDWNRRWSLSPDLNTLFRRITDKDPALKAFFDREFADLSRLQLTNLDLTEETKQFIREFRFSKLFDAPEQAELDRLHQLFREQVQALTASLEDLEPFPVFLQPLLRLAQGPAVAPDELLASGVKKKIFADFRSRIIDQLSALYADQRQEVEARYSRYRELMTDDPLISRAALAGLIQTFDDFQKCLASKKDLPKTMKL